MPMILSRAKAAQDWKPMAVGIAFGLGFATILTLLVIPVVYSIVDDIAGKFGSKQFPTRLSFKEAMKLGCKIEDAILNGEEDIH